MALRPEAVKCFPNLRFSQWSTGAQHPHSALLLERRSGAPWAQSHFLTSDDHLESVTCSDVQLVTHGLGQNDPA
jgi:hypothetical protein